MSADKELWKTGKSAKNSEDKKSDDEDTLDLSSPSPESDTDEEINLERIEEDTLPDDDNWLPPIIGPWALKRRLLEGGEGALNRIESLSREHSAG